MADFNLSTELRRYCLALAMLRHGAKPITVRQWTGFSRERTRQIVRNYNKNRSSAEPRCVPGPPRSLGLKLLLKDRQLRIELTAAAVLCRVLKIVPDRAVQLPAAQLRTPEMGESLCHAYEVYRHLVPAARMTFDHLVLLLVALSTSDRWGLERCTVCESYLLIDPLSLGPRVCVECQNRPGGHLAEDEAMEIPLGLPLHHDTGPQQSLF